MSESQSVVEAPPSRSPRSGMRFFGQKLIKIRFQLKFSLVILAFLASASALIWIQGSWFINKMVKMDLIQGEEALSQIKFLNQNIFYLSVLALAVVFGLSLFFSHFVAGPIYRFEKIFEQMREGDISAIVRLRKHDELKDTAEVFNQALMTLRQRIRKEREHMLISMEKLRKFSERLKSQGKSAEAAELDHLMADLKNTPPQIKI